MEIRPTDATLGAVVTDVDLSYLNEATFEEIEAAWHSFAVWIFPGQHLADEAQVAFTKRFGRLEFGLKRTKGALSRRSPTSTTAGPSCGCPAFRFGSSSATGSGTRTAPTNGSAR